MGLQLSPYIALPEMDFSRQAKADLLETSRTGFSLSASSLGSQSQSISEKASPISSNLSSAGTPIHLSAQSSEKLSALPTKAKVDDSQARQLIDHLPKAEFDAYGTFQLLADNAHFNKSLGCSHQSLDTMICECQYDPCSDEPHVACGPLSQCINRLTQVECLPYECPTRDACQNQRFARKQYADIEIVQTEKKGFGLRAAANIRSDDFVYEYVGEVIPEHIFRERIKEYAEEGIQHFYFMMLQKGEYIDATKRGSIARFLNHSCEPNCYVAKWVVGRRMRMGIFAKREIIRGEELTFNYNVDRYGYDAQVCFCGEHSCLGTIGGKTQTDIRIMDPLYIEALGLYNQPELGSLRGAKKRKLRTVEDIDLNGLRPLELAEVQKLVTATRQAANQGHKDIIARLLHRVILTPDEQINREIMRLKGFLTMSSIFEILDVDESDDEAIAYSALQVLDKWQPKYRNKIKECGIQARIETLLPRFPERSQIAAGHLITRWQDLTLHYEIPRIDSVGPPTSRPIADDDMALEPRWKEESRPIEFELAPVVHAIYTSRPAARESESATKLKTSMPSGVNEKAELELILAAAAAKNQSQDERDDVEDQQLSQATHDKAQVHAGERGRRLKRSKASSDELKDRRLKRLVGELVIQRLSKYKAQIDRETFKKYAEQCTENLVEKERRSESYPSESYNSLSVYKTTKMNAFIKDFARKLLRRLADRGQLLTRDRAHRTLRELSPDHTSSFSPVDSNPANVNDIISPSANGSHPSDNHEDDIRSPIDGSGIARLRPNQHVTDEGTYSSSCFSPLVNPN